MENEDNALKVTYVDNIYGAYTRFRASSDLKAALVVGDEYLLAVRLKVSAGSSVGIQIWGPGDTSEAYTNTEYEWKHIPFTAVATTGDYFSVRDFGAGEIIWIDRWELFHKTTQTGNNLIANGGARNEIGALITTDFVDSDSDGLADEITNVNSGLYSIVTGNGFISNAQRCDYVDNLFEGISWVNVLDASMDYEVTFYYRCGGDMRLDDGTSIHATYSANTGDAIKETVIMSGLSATNVAFRNSNSSSWLEIGTVEVRPIIDGEFFEPEELGGEPVIVSVNTLLANPWRYLTRYLNTTDRRDLMLIEADSDLTYEDHLKILKFIKED